MTALARVTTVALQKIQSVESAMMQCEQADIATEHEFHAGMYARTVRLAPRTVIVGALIKIPTLLVVHGHCWIYAQEKWSRVEGYRVFPASAGRKQIFFAIEATEITMVFPTAAQSVAEAEAEFTDEADKLLSRRKDELCQV